MAKLIIGIAATAALSAGAAPATAQGSGSNLDNRIENLQQQIQRGTISRSEVREMTRLESQYSRGGFTRFEQRSLQQRIQNLRQKIQFAEARGNRHERFSRR